MLPDKIDPIIELRTAVSQLKKRENALESAIDECYDEVQSKSRNGDEMGAIYELKKMKIFEKQLEAILGEKLNLETQVFYIQYNHPRIGRTTMAESSLQARGADITAIRNALYDDLDTENQYHAPIYDIIIDEDNALNGTALHVSR